MAGKLKVKLKKWDSAAHLKTEADIARYWAACLEGGATTRPSSRRRSATSRAPEA
jgi:DNA-binding phage protein